MSEHNQEEKQSNKGNSLASEENASEQAIEGVLERVAKKDPQAALDIRGYIAVQQVTHQGPMPSPDDLKQYFQTQADLPERMMKMAEYSLENKAQHHRKILELKEKEIELQQLELIKADGAHKREILTQNISLGLAFITVLVCILGAFYLALEDKKEVALVIGGTTVIGIVGAFLANKRDSKKK